LPVGLWKIYTQRYTFDKGKEVRIKDDMVTIKAEVSQISLGVALGKANLAERLNGTPCGHHETVRKGEQVIDNQNGIIAAK
jgi:hypothetical protein